MRDIKDIKRVRNIFYELSELFTAPEISYKYKRQGELMDWVLGKDFTEEKEDVES